MGRSAVAYFSPIVYMPVSEMWVWSSGKSLKPLEKDEISQEKSTRARRDKIDLCH